MRFLIVCVSVLLISVQAFSDCEDGYHKHAGYGCHAHENNSTWASPNGNPKEFTRTPLHHLHNEPDAEKPVPEQTDKPVSEGEVAQPTQPPSQPSPPAQSEPTPTPPSEPIGDDTDDVPHTLQTKVPLPEPVEPMLQPLWVTEYMMRDGGFERLPTWIELYNPNDMEVSLDGYSFTWSGGTHLIQDFSVPAETAVILATKSARHQSGIKPEQVYILEIACGRCLKSGWSLKGELIDFSEKHPAKRGNWAERESFHRYKHKNPEGYYYGRANDISCLLYTSPSPRDS